MARKQRQEEDTGTWMNTYSDLVTLLLTFFVLLYSMSSVDQEKWESFVKAFVNPGEDTSQVVLDLAERDDSASGIFPLQGETTPDVSAEEETLEPLPVDFNELYKYLKQYTQKNNMSDSVDVLKGDDVVYIRFQNNIFFDPDESYLRPSSYEILDFLGDCLHNVEDEIFMININGHTASVPNSENYRVSDWTLSSERASVIAIYLEDKKGIDPTKLRPIGYGKNFPIAPNDTEEGREQNRRVDMMIISKDSDIAQDDDLYREFSGLFDPTQFPASGGAKDILSSSGEKPSGTQKTEPGSEPPSDAGTPSSPTD